MSTPATTRESSRRSDHAGPGSERNNEEGSLDLPLLLHRRGLYYGWVILFAGTVGIIMSVPGQTMGVSVYTEFLLKRLGVSRVGLSMAYMLGTLTSALLLPLVGRLLDTIGSRVVAVIASLGLSIFLVFLAASPNITHAVVLRTQWNAKWVGLAVAFVAFLGIRHFGQGQLTVASRTMMGRWFEKRRGLVLGISGLFVAFGFGSAPLVLTSLISAFDWQRSLLALAGALCAMALFAWVTFRQSPESCGLVVDGGSSSGQAVSRPLSDGISYTVSQARRTIAFWAFNLGMAAQALLYTAITFHMGRIGQLSGISTTKAFRVFLPIAVVSTSADLLGGFLSDRVPLKYLLMAMQMGICCGLTGVHFYGASFGFVLTAIGFGISNGLFSLLSSAAWPKLFGRAHLGAIAGFNMAWIVAGSAVGPYLFGLGESYNGNYQHVIRWCLLIPGSILILSLFANQPPKETVEAQAENFADI